MLFDPDKNPEKEKEDYFEADPDDLPKKEEEPKKPAAKPDDIDYWEQEESEWEHLKPGPRRAVWYYIGGVLALAVVLVLLWVRFFSPYVEDAVQYGYVESIEKRGVFFKSYEGMLIPYKDLMDTTRLYSRNFPFTAADAKVAIQLKKMQFAARPVMVTYRQYHATVPWRGSNKIVVTAVDTVDPHKILPPEFQPEVLRAAESQEKAGEPQKKGGK